MFGYAEAMHRAYKNKHEDPEHCYYTDDEYEHFSRMNYRQFEQFRVSRDEMIGVFHRIRHATAQELRNGRNNGFKLPKRVMDIPIDPTELEWAQRHFAG